jgi:hypothetical protein
MVILMVAPAAGDNPFRVRHEKNIAHGMPRLNSIGHIAGKLALRLYGLLKQDELYDEDLDRRSLGLPPRAQTRASSAEVPLDTLDHLNAQVLGAHHEPLGGVALT